MTARICWWCGQLDDLRPHPRTGAPQRCPCNANTVTPFDVEVRHRKAVRAARARDWAGNAGDRTRPRVIGANFGRRRAA